MNAILNTWNKLEESYERHFEYQVLFWTIMHIFTALEPSFSPMGEFFFLKVHVVAQFDKLYFTERLK